MNEFFDKGAPWWRLTPRKALAPEPLLGELTRLFTFVPGAPRPLRCGLCGLEMKRFAFRCEYCEQPLPGWPGALLGSAPACVRFLRGCYRVRAGRPRGALACAARRHHRLSDALARVKGLVFTVRYRSCGRPDDQSEKLLVDLVALEDHVRRQTDAAAAKLTRVLFAATPGLQRDSRGRCLVVEHDLGFRSAHFSGVDVDRNPEYAPFRRAK